MKKQTLKEMNIAHSPRQSNDGFLSQANMFCPPMETILERQLRITYLKEYQIGLIQFYNSDDAKKLSVFRKGSIQAEITDIEIRIKNTNKIINL